MKRIFACFLVAGVAVATLPALAHDQETGPNGGQQISVKDRHVELVTRGAELAVYLSDAKHAPIAVAGIQGRAVVQSGGDTKLVTLQAGEPNRLIGTAATTLAAGSRIVISATLPGGETVQARFVVK